MKQLMSRAWRGWVEIAGYFGDFQARLLLTLFYGTVFIPFAMIARALTDPLHMRKTPARSGWIIRHEHRADLPSTRQQF